MTNADKQLELEAIQTVDRIFAESTGKSISQVEYMEFCKIKEKVIQFRKLKTKK